MFNLYFGPVINPENLSEYAALPRCLIAVGSDGNIVWIEEDIDPMALRDTIAAHGLKDAEYTLVDFSARPGEFIMPGLIDTHVHACQFPNLGFGGELEVDDWIIKYALPTERKFANNGYAEQVYNQVVDRSIVSGTTTSCYFATSHLEATTILADIIWQKGQRAFVGVCIHSTRGKRSADQSCPDDYTEPSAQLEDTKNLIKYIQALPLSRGDERLVYPIITPRFAPSRGKQLMAEIGRLAESLPHVALQVHISECRKEVRYTLEKFGTETYAEIFQQYGLLRPNTILAHGVWLTEKEMEMIAEIGAGVAHCPTSNFYLTSGMARIGLLLDYGVKVGLGTDVSGGYSPSILYTIQMASAASKMVSLQSELEEERRREICEHGKHVDAVELPSDPGLDGKATDDKDEHHGHHHRRRPHQRRDFPIIGHHFANQKLEIPTLLYLATLGGAAVCSLSDRIGSFAIGKAFDALYVSVDDSSGNPSMWGMGVDEQEKERTANNLKRWLERFLFCGDDRNVRRVFVQGVQIGGADMTQSG